MADLCFLLVAMQPRQLGSVDLSSYEGPEMAERRCYLLKGPAGVVHLSARSALEISAAVARDLRSKALQLNTPLLTLERAAREAVAAFDVEMERRGGGASHG